MQGKQEPWLQRPRDKSRRGTSGTTTQASRPGCHNSDLVESLMFFLYGYLTWSSSTKTQSHGALIWSRWGHAEPFMILNSGSKQKHFSSGPGVWAGGPVGQSAQDTDKTTGELNQYLHSLLHFLSLLLVLHPHVIHFIGPNFN